MSHTQKVIILKTKLLNYTLKKYFNSRLQTKYMTKLKAEFNQVKNIHNLNHNLIRTELDLELELN